MTKPAHTHTHTHTHTNTLVKQTKYILLFLKEQTLLRNFEP